MLDLPTYVAADSGDLDRVQRLVKVEEGANINVKEVCGWTPLIHASSKGHFETVHFLLANGANVDDYNDEGRTSLWYASLAGHFRVACLLLHHGASTFHVDSWGNTPVDIASGECKTRINWEAFQQHQMITPGNVSSFIDNEPAQVGIIRKMMQAIMMQEEQHEKAMQQHNEVIHGEMADLRETIMTDVRQEHASLREILQTLMQQQAEFHQQDMASYQIVEERTRALVDSQLMLLSYWLNSVDH